MDGVACPKMEACPVCPEQGGDAWVRGVIGYQSVGHRHLPHEVVIQCNFHGAQDSIACVPGTAVPTGLSLRWCPGVSGGV